MINRRELFLQLAAGTTSSHLLAQSASRKTRNVVLVSVDGLRWQDVFRGADPLLMNMEHGGVDSLEDTRKRFWRESPEERRQTLMPFVWSVLAEEGQIYGNRDLGSDAFVTNGRNFSYPGYNELLTGSPDDRIDSNDKKKNPNISVLEWLNRKKAYKGKVAAFAAWDCLPFILNSERAGFLVNAGYEPYRGRPGDDRVTLLNRMKTETGVWESEPLDAPIFHLALHYLQREKPRVLYLSLGEPDEWAHSGRYDLYLASSNRVDAYLKELWTVLQSIPNYRDSTTLIVTVDHGRGSDGESWKSHGEKLPESQYVWLGILGPDTPAMGERSKATPITQSQIAATLTAFLGEDYQVFSPKAGAPIRDAMLQR